MNEAAFLQHGTRHKRMPTAPDIGDRVAYERVAIDLIPARPIEVNFVSDCDVITVPLGFSTWRRSFDSEKITFTESSLGHMNVHWKGVECYVANRSHACEMIAFIIDPALREGISQDLSMASLPVELRSFGSLPTPKASTLAPYLRKLHLSGLIQGQLAAESLAALVLTDILETLSGTKLDEKRSGRLDERRLNILTELIETHLDANFGLTNMAEAIDMSPYHFARAFKESTGLSPHQYVMERRIGRARVLMSTTSATLAEVAYATGFSSQAHMTNVFRRKLGVTPGTYRSLTHH
ncbi:MAG: AraC family transcriptional regulator [Pseudomonadota bacterium]